MLDINITKENTHIVNSYLITTKIVMRDEIDYTKMRREVMKYPITRSTESYVREWKGHNRLYNLGEWLKKIGLFTKFAKYLQDHAKDADLEEYLGIKGKIKGFLLSIIWLILGGV